MEGVNKDSIDRFKKEKQIASVVVVLVTSITNAVQSRMKMGTRFQSPS